MKLNRIPELPEEITVLEFLPEENIKKKECTIICAQDGKAEEQIFINLFLN